MVGRVLWGGANAREVRSGVHGSGVIAVTVDFGNADVPIIDIKPANKTASTIMRDAPYCDIPLPPHPDRLSRPCDDAALAAADVGRDGSVTSLDVLIIQHVAMRKHEFNQK